jgi:hypothetical protein
MLATRKALAGVLAGAAVICGVAALAGQSTAGVPLTTSSGGLAVCPAADLPAITSPDGTICRNVGGLYSVLNAGTTDVHTLQVTLRGNYKGFVSATVREPDSFDVTVGYPANSKTLYAGPLEFYYYVAR